MSTSVLPSLAGFGIDVTRESLLSTVINDAVSGKETRIANWLYPKYKWTVMFNVLRSASAYNELQTLMGFFNARLGMFDTFLYQDSDDNSVTGQSLGTGNGVLTQFQLIRSFGGFIEPILAPHTVSAVYINGVLQSSGWSVSNWGSSTPGVITFTSPPANGLVITADFSYYFPVRMVNDNLAFSRIVSGMYNVKSFAFQSVKN